MNLLQIRSENTEHHSCYIQEAIPVHILTIPVVDNDHEHCTPSQYSVEHHEKDGYFFQYLEFPSKSSWQV